MVDQVDGIDIGIVIRERKPNDCRISVRSYGAYSACAVCSKFGGAGHADRAGGNLTGTPEEVLRLVEEICREEVEKAGNR